MIFKYLWIRWINKIELKMILYFFCSSPLNFFTCALSSSPELDEIHISFAQSFCIRKN
jgi:hypothetical protein